VAEAVPDEALTVPKVAAWGNGALLTVVPAASRADADGDTNKVAHAIPGAPKMTTPLTMLRPKLARARRLTNFWARILIDMAYPH